MSRISQTIAINKKTGPFRSELNTLIIYIYVYINVGVESTLA